MTFTLGISLYHDSTAALIEDGKVLSGISEERLTQVKHDGRFPKNAIKWILDKHHISKKDIKVVMSENLTNAFNDKHYKRPVDFARYFKNKVMPSPNLFYNELKKFKEYKLMPHEESHAFKTYVSSGFKDATVIVLDGEGTDYGRISAGGAWHGKNGKMENLGYFPYADSIGEFYACATEVMGWKRNDGEWKLMGLAPYGKKYIKEVEVIYNKKKKPHIAHKLREYYIPKLKEIYKTSNWMDFAYTVQKIAEDTIIKYIENAVKETKSKNVCLAGGVFYNIKANQLIKEAGYNVFIYPNSGDGGLAVGTALLDQGMGIPIDTVYYGTEYDYNKGVKCDPVEKARSLLEKGEIVAWYQGAAEFGPRALGNRSILALPKDPEMRDRINALIKHREWWRPFCPSMTIEGSKKYLLKWGESPYMIMGFKAKNAEDIASVVHVDGTTRPQTVRREHNQKYYDLIKSFDVPVVLNTSLNLAGNPIVNTPEDAISVLKNSDLRYAIINDRFIDKKKL